MGLSEKLHAYIQNQQDFSSHFLQTLFNMNHLHLNLELQLAVQNVVLNLIDHPDFETSFFDHFVSWTKVIAQAANQSPEAVATWLNVDLIVYQLNRQPDLNTNLLDILIDLVYYGGDSQMMSMLSKCRLAD